MVKKLNAKKTEQTEEVVGTGPVPDPVHVADSNEGLGEEPPVSSSDAMTLKDLEDRKRPATRSRAFSRPQRAVVIDGKLPEVRGEPVVSALDEKAHLRADGTPRYVQALIKSYVNGVMLTRGQITTWPVGLKTLGKNLREVNIKD
jgi:hypothetical protein